MRNQCGLLGLVALHQSGCGRRCGLAPGIARARRGGFGLGKALLAHLARRCVVEELGRFEWSVLDWNTPSIEFYKSLGAKPMDEWTVFRLDKNGISDLAGK